MASKPNIEALERRVQTLEQEFDVVKHQIQATLLDIQEQLLTNTHPSLRAEEAASSEDRRQLAAPDHPAKSFSAVQSVPATAPQSATEMPGNSHGEPSSLPTVRKVSLEDLTATQPSSPSSHKTAPIPPGVPSADWSSLSKSERWVKERVAEMGGERTRGLIEVYAKNGRFSAKTKRTLLELVSVYDAKGTSPQKDSSRQHQPKQSQPRRGSQPKALPQKSAPSKKGPQPQASVRSQPVVQDRKQSRPDTSPVKDEGESQHLILKLIAGVQNASAGVFRRTKEK